MSNSVTDRLTIFILVLAFITKRAIFPFSPWLPIAIAAPTPISALVHSSTLVTSGLFLIMRYSHMIYSSYFMTKVLLFFCVFTSFYAGLNCLFETDLKKLIALSTLRHLGFIGMSFACGLLSLSFFHLLVHALFKSLLFMTIGDVIVSLNHAQDVRYLSKGHAYTPFSSFIMSVCLVNLLGVPRLSGFFRKDLILELLNYNSFSFLCSFVVYANVLFTFFYTFQLFFFSFQRVKVSPFQLFHSPSILHSSLLLVMSFFTLFFS
jgi:NADH-ubiquinone oxidoreductase chain 5